MGWIRLACGNMSNPNELLKILVYSNYFSLLSLRLHLLPYVGISDFIHLEVEISHFAKSEYFFNLESGFDYPSLILDFSTVYLV